MIHSVSDSNNLIQKKDVFRYERKAALGGFRVVAGLDEAGRGPLAGPVVAAAVVLNTDQTISGVDDSKRVSARNRVKLYDVIIQSARCYAIALASPRVIETINILEATRLAMRQAVGKLSEHPDYLLLDAIRIPALDIPQEPIVKGDQLSHSIAAASILAKVVRDRIMVAWDRKYPQYQWSKNKGYGTAEHLAAIKKFGPTPFHRMTFRGVYDAHGLFDLT